MAAELIPRAHDELVVIGRKFLEGNHKAQDKSLPAHAIIVTGIGAREIPDVLGFFGGGHTTLIECKTSRADFRTDGKKRFRRHPEQGVGNYRYYLAPQGLLSVDELPEKWGLMEECGGKIKVAKVSEHRLEVCKYAELSILQSLIRRIGQNAPEGVSIKFYTYETQNTCTAGVRTEESPTGQEGRNGNNRITR